MNKIIPVLSIALILSTASIAQLTKVPSSAKENFEAQYPSAENVEWFNEVLSASVSFTLNGEQLVAEYSNKGIWKNTLKEISFDDLPEAVKTGLKLSKYSDWELQAVKKIYYPGDLIQYRIKVEKNDIQKKYLFFKADGKLVRDSITL